MFAASEHYSEEMAMVGDGVRVGDGALLIWNSQGCAGKDEFCKWVAISLLLPVNIVIIISIIILT